VQRDAVAGVEVQKSEAAENVSGETIVTAAGQLSAVSYQVSAV
jgi:hypothetical protein